MGLIFNDKEKNEVNTKEIIISDNLKEVLTKMQDNTIADLLISGKIDEKLITKPEKEINYIDLSHSHKGHISYITKDKVDRMDQDDVDYWRPKYRYSAKPGSFAKKFLHLGGWEIETFSNRFLAIVDPPQFRFEIVKSNDIAKYYHHSTYYQQTGSLGGSCMKNVNEKYFDIYTENQENINMLVMFDQYDKVMGRSILWIGEDFKLLDRIYVCNDSYITYFQEWAKNNDCYYKEFNNWSTPKQIVYKDEKIIKEFSIKLKNVDFERYPYLDTFKFLDRRNHIIYNYIPKGRKDELIVVSDHMGSYLQPGYFAFCDVDNTLYPGCDVSHIEYKNMDVYQGRLVYSDSLDTYILKDDSVYSDEYKDHIFNENYKNLNDEEKLNKRLDYLKNKPAEDNWWEGGGYQYKSSRQLIYYGVPDEPVYDTESHSLVIPDTEDCAVSENLCSSVSFTEEEMTEIIRKYD